jgi:DNA (cytosine-5)-methyltransferase 1
LEPSGWACVWSNDIDKYANQIYKKNFGDGELIEGDIRQISEESIPEHTLLTAGFPCQSFSLAGKRQGFKDIRGTLFYEVARVAKTKRPKLLLLENVKGLLSAQRGYCFFRILEILDELGYDVEWQVLNSKHFGVPQNRERVFIVGHLRGAGSRQIFPIEQINKLPLREAESQSEGGEASTLEASYGKTKNLSNMVYDGHHHQFTEKMGTLTGRENRQGTNWLIVADRTRSYANLGRNLESPKPITNALSGVQKDNLVVHTTQPRSGNPKKGGVGPLSRSDGITYALDCPNSQVIEIANALDRDEYLRSGTRPRDENGKPLLLPIGYRRIRRLTPIECERLQGFPDGWTEGVSDTQRYKLLGNAVTVNVVEFLGLKLRSCLEVCV